MSEPRPGDIFRLNGNHARAQYLARGTVEDLELYVKSYRQAVEATPDGDPVQLATLNNFGLALRTRFNHLGSHTDLDEAIDVCQVVHALTPDDSPDKPPRLSNLAGAIADRFELRGDSQDLEEAISLETRALNLAPDGDKSRPQSLNNLGVHLYKKFRQTGLSVNLSKAITLQNQAVDLTPEDHPNKSSWLSNLSNLMQQRYNLEGNIEDLEQAIALQSHAIRLTPTQHPYWPAWTSTLGMQLLSRFMRLKDKEDIQRAVTFCEHAVERTPDGHPGKPIFLNNLANSLEQRYINEANPQDLAQAITCWTQAIDLTPDSRLDKSTWLHNLGNVLTRFRQRESEDPLKRAIELQSQAIELLPEGHSSKPLFLYRFGSSLLTRFQELGNAADINMAISCSAQSVELLPADHPSQAAHLRLLGIIYETRAISSHSQSEDLTNSFLSLSKAMQCTSASPVEQLRAAGQYAKLISAHSSLLDTPTKISLLQAYELQLSAVPKCVWLGNSVRGRYTSQDLPVFGSIVSKATAAAIDAGDSIKALEWLESGRTLVWSQILQLYAPLDNLQRFHPRLASRLHYVSQALQYAATPLTSPMQPPTTATTATTAVAHFTQTQLEIQAKSSHSFAVEYGRLITQVRKLEGFESFLKPKTVSQLAGACRSGPVAVINVHQSRCDSLVLYNSEEVQVQHIPLSSLSLDHATKLHKVLWSILTARSLRGRSRDGSYTQNEDTDRGAHVPGKGMRHDPMFKILADLWTMVVKPIINFIGTLVSPLLLVFLNRVQPDSAISQHQMQVNFLTLPGVLLGPSPSYLFMLLASTMLTVHRLRLSWTMPYPPTPPPLRHSSNLKHSQILPMRCPKYLWWRSHPHQGTTLFLGLLKKPQL